MTIIKKISEMIEDELEGAEEYIKCALKHREDNPVLAKVFFDISMQEMTHVDMLHSEVAKLIANYQKEHGEPPVAMKAVYDYVHEKHIEEANEIKMYQSMFRS